MKKEVEILLGEPKKAILKISWPMMLGMVIHSLYNLADGAWVAGLGTDALSAIGLFYPFFMVIVAVGMALGIGGGSAISRRIGERNKKEADNTALHMLYGGLGISLILSMAILPFLDKIFITFSNNEKVGQLTADYAEILVGGSIFMIFNHLADAILRSEGDSKRAMYAMILGSILNIFLDPLFIYGFDMGIKGAAWATLASIIISTCIFYYWLFFKKNTYLDLTLKDFHFSGKIINEILGVGIPSFFAQISMSISMIVMNKIIIWTGGTTGVAILTSGWRIIMLGSIPLMGLVSGATTVLSAAFGAQSKEKLKTAFLYSIRIGLIMEIVIGIVIYITAGHIAFLFTYSENSRAIHYDLIIFLRYLVFIYPSIPFGMLSAALFRAINQGGKSLIVTILRTIILQITLTWLLGIYFKMGLIGVWKGIIIGNFIAVSISFAWANYSISRIKWQLPEINITP
ncbi:MAG: MATE family efflux transporter [Candidatus Marinimicrobia bacterium]|nr:MATE family efflux transporter [Candidatus Neomarinimicrobiota bacterium]